MIKAIESFDPRQGVAPEHYAVPYIRGAMQRTTCADPPAPACSLPAARSSTAAARPCSSNACKPAVCRPRRKALAQALGLPTGTLQEVLRPPTGHCSCAASMPPGAREILLWPWSTCSSHRRPPLACRQTARLESPCLRIPEPQGLGCGCGWAASTPDLRQLLEGRVVRRRRRGASSAKPGPEGPGGPEAL